MGANGRCQRGSSARLTYEHECAHRHLRRPPAVARGRLEERPFPRLLHQLFSKRVTGCLQLIDDSRDESRVYLRDGVPVHVMRPNDIDRLDQVIMEANLVPTHLVAELSAALPPGRRLGEVLVERGLVSPAGLADALKFQLRRKLLRLFFPQRGQFAVFVEAHNFGVGDEFKETRVDPRCLMYPGVRAAYDEARLKAELAPLTNHRFRMLPTLAGSLLEAMGFKANDPMLVSLGEKLHALADLPASGQRGLDARAIVLALLYTDLLETTPIAPAAVSLAETERALPAVTDAMIAEFPATAPAARPAVSAGMPSGSYQAVSVVGATRPALRRRRRGRRSLRSRAAARTWRSGVRDRSRTGSAGGPATRPTSSSWRSWWRGWAASRISSCSAWPRTRPTTR